MQLINRTIVITGASSGLGEALARTLHKEGANLILIARREDRLQTLASELHADYLLYDLEEAPEILAKTLANRYGRIDILINNAGFGEFSFLDDTSIETIESMHRINVLSPVRLTKACLPLLREGGMIVNVASQAGKLPTPKSTIYCMTKAAMLQFSNALRLELRPKGIHVMTVNPGPIATEFFVRADVDRKYEQNVASIVLSKERLASTVVRAIERRKREVNAPWWMELSAKGYGVMPRLIEWLGKPGFDKK
ncbi:SDR family oxidoreductase [Exiguobacterium sp. LL15]|uniref:SDR family NAD(P)-dependent oxidoreductase n=1 Tax=Exiguobacterium sp. LL15 TaxID=2950547 RepID=UPI00210E13B5|nr:SDR family oxidoreductase [Exiguobacterium sp. LL15]MCQ4090898.1 SDR family oxidoreductase [Exiguobacterium sp. LL15]